MKKLRDSECGGSATTFKRVAGNGNGYVLLAALVVLVAICAVGVNLITTVRSSQVSSIYSRKRARTRYAAEAAASAVVNMAANRITVGTLPDTTFAFEVLDHTAKVKMAMERKNGVLELKATRGLFDLLTYTYYGNLETTVHQDLFSKVVIMQRIRFEEYPIFQFERFMEGTWEHILGKGVLYEFKGRMHFNNFFTEVSAREINFHDWVTSCCHIYFRESYKADLPKASFTCKEGDTLLPRLTATGVSEFTPVTDIYWPDAEPPGKVAEGEEVPRLTLPVGGLPPVVLIQKKDHDEYGRYMAGYDNESLFKHKMVHKADLILRKQWTGGVFSYQWRENTSGASDVPSPYSSALLDPIVDLDTVITNPAIPDDAYYDYWMREWMSVGYIDVGALCCSLDVYYPDDGTGMVLFLEGTWDTLNAAVRYEGGRDTSQGIRDVYILMNGDSLSRPLTIATNVPIYVWGDYNRTSPVQSSAIIADFHGCLSNAWSIDYGDDHYGATAAGRPASNTTTNYCVMTGITREWPSASYNDPYDPNYYHWHVDAGIPLERAFAIYLYEDWQSPGATRKWRGSQVNMWRSMYIDNEEYHYGKVTNMPDGTRRGYWTAYQKPFRDVGYDTMYNAFHNMPPGTPRIASPLVVDYYEIR
ncbi:MAG: hypothetical protein GF344_00315 [Chitinivibrionales bacterium]|nr:hypothetical protein [Chitinivibrionales bacterium]MBD3355570.1 hypothetical protein [Chitinivibrionales bacterium]